MASAPPSEVPNFIFLLGGSIFEPKIVEDSKFSKLSSTKLVKNTFKMNILALLILSITLAYTRGFNPTVTKGSVRGDRINWGQVRPQTEVVGWRSSTRLNGLFDGMKEAFR